MQGIAIETLRQGEQAGQRYCLGLPRQAPIGMTGAVLASRAGSSLEFRDYRDYQPGDDLRHIDWNAYARNDQLAVKVFREEIHPHVDVMIDTSRSMDLDDSPKADATLALAAFLATASVNAGFGYQAWQLGHDLHRLGSYCAPPQAWTVPTFADRGEPARALASGAGTLRSRGLRFFLSDLLWLGEPQATMNHLANRAAQVVVLQVLARADVDPPADGNLRLVDRETDEIRELFVDTAAVRRYQAALQRHQENWDQACRQAGAIFVPLIAEELLETWRLDALVARDVLQVY